MKIEANTLDEAFSKAALELNCSVTELEYEILQNASFGFFGLFRKNAIIEAFKKGQRDKKSVKKVKKHGEITDEIILKVNKELTKLFSFCEFSISEIEVSKFSKDTLLVFIDGDDAALLIGKDGKRYKAILYMISSWINTKFNLKVRLEISKFLQNQEEKISDYLKDVIAKVNESGKAKTKILDSLLIEIALKELRNKIKDKYIGVKTTKEGKYIIINDK